MKLVLNLQKTTVDELSVFVALLQRANVEGPDGLMLHTPALLETGPVSLSFNVPTELLKDLVAP